MKLRDFLKSKRTWAIIVGASVELLSATFPNQFVGPSEILRVLLTGLK